VSVESAPGHGSTFTMRLGAVVAPDRDAASPAALALEPAAGPA
jgi:hypothetical protein